MLKRVGIAVGVVGLIFRGVAFAAPGDHIGTDNVELIPSVSLSTEHRTNVYLREGELGGGEPVAPGTSLRIQPYVTLDAHNDDVRFRFNAGYLARKYFQEQPAENLDRFRDFNLGADLNLLRNSVVGLRIRDNFHLNGFETEAEKADNAYIQVIRNRASGRLNIRPGKSLQLDLGGDLNTSNFQTPAGSNQNFVRTGQNNRIGYGPGAEATWRFLPKTAVVGSWSMEWFNWANNLVIPSGDNNDAAYGEYLGVPDGRSLRAEAGLRGRFTEKLVIGATAGYGSALYEERTVLDEIASLNQFVNQAERNDDFDTDLQTTLFGVNVDYAITDNHAFSIGYRKDFQDVFFTNVVAFNQGTVGYDGMFFDRVGFNTSLNYRLEDYQGEVARLDHRVVVTGDLRVIATKYLDINAGSGWRRRASADGLNPDIEFDDYSFQLGARFIY